MKFFVHCSVKENYLYSELYVLVSNRIENSILSYVSARGRDDGVVLKLLRNE